MHKRLLQIHFLYANVQVTPNISWTGRAQEQLGSYLLPATQFPEMTIMEMKWPFLSNITEKGLQKHILL